MRYRPGIAYVEIGASDVDRSLDGSRRSTLAGATPIATLAIHRNSYEIVRQLLSNLYGRPT